jgi:dienelactone hydrolase
LGDVLAGARIFQNGCGFGKAMKHSPYSKHLQRLIVLGVVALLLADVAGASAQRKKLRSLFERRREHTAVTSPVSQQKYGKGALAYWIYQPQGTPSSSAPVVLFLHGWMGMNPYLYGGWIDHLVKRGNIVIFPVFQLSKEEKPDEMVQNTMVAFRNSVNQLNQSNTIRPDWNRFAIVGHSFGGGLSVQVAGRAAEANLPVPKAIMPVTPGWRGSNTIPTTALSQIPESARMWIVEGTDDQYRGTRQGDTIYTATRKIPGTRKRFIVLSSSNPSLKSDHFAPLSPLESYQDNTLSERERKQQRIKILIVNKMSGLPNGKIDALDTNGYWKLFDLLCQVSFGGNNNISSSSDGAYTPENPMKFVVEP